MRASASQTPAFQTAEKDLPPKGFGGKDSWKGNRQGSNAIKLRETCHSEAVTDVTAVGIRIQNVRENGLPRQSADWLAMTKPLTEWHCQFLKGLSVPF